MYLSATNLIEGHTCSRRTFNEMNIMEHKSVYQLFKHDLNIGAVLKSKNNQLIKHSTFYICDALKKLGFNLIYSPIIKENVTKLIKLDVNRANY